MKYFKHDLSTRDDDKIFELIEAHGMQGYGLWWVLLEELYKAEDQGFRLEATDTWFKRLSKQLNLTDWRTLIRTLGTMAEQGLIDPQLWAEHVIFAPGVAEHAEAYSKEREQARLRKQRQRGRYNRPSEREWMVIRDRIFARDGYVCQYCGAKDVKLHCDHVIPVSRGGTNDDENLATACETCNLRKYNKTPQEWLGGSL
jgi:hypothetical protein